MNKMVVCVGTHIASDGSINYFDISKGQIYDVLRETNNPPAYEILLDNYKCCFVPKILFKDVE